MRLLLVLILIMVSTSSHSDVYNENGEYVGREYNTTESATFQVAITAVGFLFSTEYRDIKSHKIVIDRGTETMQFDICDDACKEEIKAEVVKKYSFQHQSK
jgi:hypothetical protein